MFWPKENMNRLILLNTEFILYLLICFDVFSEYLKMSYHTDLEFIECHLIASGMCQNIIYECNSLRCPICVYSRYHISKQQQIQHISVPVADHKLQIRQIVFPELCCDCKQFLWVWKMLYHSGFKTSSSFAVMKGTCLESFPHEAITG